jgi:glycosyltransferase involved in cell wall biosynthesis
MAGVDLPPQVSVAIFLTRFEPGGTERQMTELVRRLDPSRFRVHVACFDKAGAWLPRVLASAASVVEFPIRGFARPGTVRQLLAFARWCRREGIRVVHTCDFYANVFGLPGAALAGVPVRIGSRRELNPDKSAAQIRLQRHAYRFATAVAANSTAAERALVREGLAPGSIAVIPNGVDIAAFPAGEDRGARRILRSVITVANLRPEKNHRTLIDAAAQLCRAFPDIRFRIVGEGPARRQLEDDVASRNLQHHVLFLGHREDVAPLLAAADVFVLPSRSEACPNSVIEAMAAGLPVVAGAVGGLPDLVEHGRTGVLVDPADAGALAAAIRGLIEDPAQAARLGEAARAHVRGRYSFERMVASFQDLYAAGPRGGAFSRARRAQAAGA